MGILMLDLDHFKKFNFNFNDPCGHDAGDAVLREAAAFLPKNVRAQDFCLWLWRRRVCRDPAHRGLEGSWTRAKRLQSKKCGN